jgi:hypothetical protein
MPESDDPCESACDTVGDCGPDDFDLDECLEGCEEARDNQPEEFVQAIACVDDHLAGGACDLEAFEACMPDEDQCESICDTLGDCDPDDFELDECLQGCGEARENQPEEFAQGVACVDDHLADGACDLEAFDACLPEFEDQCESICDTIGVCNPELDRDDCVQDCGEARQSEPEEFAVIVECIDDHLADGACDREAFDACEAGADEECNLICDIMTGCIPDFERIQCLEGCRNDQQRNPEGFAQGVECVAEHLADGACEVEAFNACLP